MSNKKEQTINIVKGASTLFQLALTYPDCRAAITTLKRVGTVCPDILAKCEEYMGDVKTLSTAKYENAANATDALTNWRKGVVKYLADTVKTLEATDEDAFKRTVSKAAGALKVVWQDVETTTGEFVKSLLAIPQLQTVYDVCMNDDATTDERNNAGRLARAIGREFLAIAPKWEGTDDDDATE